MRLIKWTTLLLFLLCFYLHSLGQDSAPAIGGINEEKMCEAIFRAEGVNSRHPYGIMRGCKGHEECRESCLAKLRDYKESFKENGLRGTRNFIIYSSRRYVGSNDPEGRENWVKNVYYFYTHSARLNVKG